MFAEPKLSSGVRQVKVRLLHLIAFGTALAGGDHSRFTALHEPPSYL